jgi:hypothetical protein
VFLGRKSNLESFGNPVQLPLLLLTASSKTRHRVHWCPRPGALLTAQFLLFLLTSTASCWFAILFVVLTSSSLKVSFRLQTGATLYPQLDSDLSFTHHLFCRRKIKSSSCPWPLFCSIRPRRIFSCSQERQISIHLGSVRRCWQTRLKSPGVAGTCINRCQKLSNQLPALHSEPFGVDCHWRAPQPLHFIPRLSLAIKSGLPIIYCLLIAPKILELDSLTRCRSPKFEQRTVLHDSLRPHWSTALGLHCHHRGRFNTIIGNNRDWLEMLDFTSQGEATPRVRWSHRGPHAAGDIEERSGCPKFSTLVSYGVQVWHEAIRATRGQ